MVGSNPGSEKSCPNPAWKTINTTSSEATFCCVNIVSISDLAKSKASLEEASIRLQSACAYTQKSQSSIQTSQLYYQRALSELQGITGAMTAPEQQQQSQRREQGAAT